MHARGARVRARPCVCFCSSTQRQPRDHSKSQRYVSTRKMHTHAHTGDPRLHCTVVRRRPTISPSKRIPHARQVQASQPSPAVAIHHVPKVLSCHRPLGIALKAVVRIARVVQLRHGHDLGHLGAVVRPAHAGAVATRRHRSDVRACHAGARQECPGSPADALVAVPPACLARPGGQDQPACAAAGCRMPQLLRACWGAGKQHTRMAMAAAHTHPGLQLCATPCWCCPSC